MRLRKRAAALSCGLSDCARASHCAPLNWALNRHEGAKKGGEEDGGAVLAGAVCCIV